MSLNRCTRTSAVFGLAVFSAVLGMIVPTHAAEPKLVVTTDRAVRTLSVVCDTEPHIAVGISGHYGDLIDGVALEFLP